MVKHSMLDRAMTLVLTIASVVAVVILVEGRLRTSQTESASNRVENIEKWLPQLELASTSLDDTSRPVKIAIFTDFECPYCKRMDSTVVALQMKHPGKIVRSVLHFPIPTHQHAQAAAMAFDCAAAQGRAEDMHRALYDGQMSYGTKSWLSYASSAGVTDFKQFASCMEQDSTSEKIRSGIALAGELKVQGTPTVVVNGWLFHSPMPSGIERAVNAVIAGKSPKP